MRLHRALCLLLAGLVLFGCGDPDEGRPGVRLRIITSAHDGPIEGKLRLQSAEERDKVFDVEPMGDEPDLYIGPDVPPGRYRVFTDKGWGMLWSGGLGTSVPTLRGAGEPVTPVRMGRPHTIYIAPTDPALWQLGDVWGADTKPASDPKGGFRPVPFESNLDDEGIVTMRFRPQDWKLGNVIRVLGQMSSGQVTNLLSYVIRDPDYVDLPRLAMVHGAQHAPLRLMLVPPPGVAQVPDGTRAQVALLGMPPFPTAYEEKSHRGSILFDGVAALGGGLRIGLPDAPKHSWWDLEANEWRLGGGMFLVVLDPKKTAQVPLERSADPIVEAYVRYPKGRAFGRLPLVRQEDIDPPAYLLTHPGPQAWLLKTASGAWHRHRTNVESGAHAHPAPALAPPEKGCRMKGSLKGGGIGYRIDFRPILEDGPVDGFTARVSHMAEYDVDLPPGKVEIQVIGPTGIKSAVKTQVLRPGASIRRDLRTR